MALRRNCLNFVHSGGTKLFPGGTKFAGRAHVATIAQSWRSGAIGFTSATPNFREGGAIRSSKHKLVLELKMLGRWTVATICKALASKAEPVAPPMFCRRCAKLPHTVLRTFGRIRCPKLLPITFGHLTWSKVLRSSDTARNASAAWPLARSRAECDWIGCQRTLAGHDYSTRCILLSIYVSARRAITAARI
jgi:hypothetical protein